MLQASDRMCTDRGRFKKDTGPIVHRHYGMDSKKPQDNMNRAQELLQSSNFIYPVHDSVSFFCFVKYLADFS